MTYSYFPVTWKVADVIPIPKQGKDLTFPDHYRPISLLSNLGKITEKAIMLRLSKHAESFIQDEQHGFRKNYSTEHQLLRVIEYINEGFNTNRSTGAIFLDVAKACDKVWHQGLICKLYQKGIPAYLIKVINSYLECRSFKIKMRNIRSKPRPIESGVPQGSALGPLLFIIFMSDLNANNNTIMALFADDLAVLFKHKKPDFIVQKLNNQLERIQEWYNTWRLNINAEKCQAIFFTKRFMEPQSNLVYDEEEIEWRNDVKYLEVTLDKRLNFTAHINNRVKSTKIISIS